MEVERRAANIHSCEVECGGRGSTSTNEGASCVSCWYEEIVEAELVAKLKDMEACEE